MEGWRGEGDEKERILTGELGRRGRKKKGY